MSGLVERYVAEVHLRNDLQHTPMVAEQADALHDGLAWGLRPVRTRAWIKQGVVANLDDEPT